MNITSRVKTSMLLAAAIGFLFFNFGMRGQSHQAECLLLSGIAVFFACIDAIVYLRVSSPNPKTASPATLPLVLLAVVAMILVPLYTTSMAIRCWKAVDNVSYAVKKDTGVVRQVFGGDKEVELADTYKDAPVTVIEKAALAYRSSMEKVKFPAQLKEIRDSALTGCTGLTQVELPDGVEKIGNSAFSGCKNLKRVVIPASVKDIPKSAFNGCPKDMVVVGAPGSAAQDYGEKYFAFEPVSP